MVFPYKARYCPTPCHLGLNPPHIHVEVSLEFINVYCPLLVYPPPVQATWTRELGQLGFQPDWEVVWSNRDLTSQNVAHQLI